MTTTTKTKPIPPRKTRAGKPVKPARAGKAGTNGGRGSTNGSGLPHQTVWEDTVIIAFRDLQWHRWREAVQNAKGDEQAALLASSPADLHKLDHDAESAFGDVLTSQDARYFVFEFKAVRDGHLDERSKGMFERLSHVVAMAEKHVDANGQFPEPLQTMLDLSRRCHFGVFGLRVALPPGTSTSAASSESPAPVDLSFMFQKGGASPALPADTVELRLLADPYIEWVNLANRALADAFIKKPRTSARITARQDKANAAVADAKTRMAQIKARASDAMRGTAVALLSKAYKLKVLANRDERAAQLATGQTAIKRISINQIDHPIPLESIVWEPLPATNYGVKQHELAFYLAALLDLPGPGQPESPDGGSPGDEMRINLVRVRNGKEVVQWTLTAAQIRNTAMMQQLFADADNPQTSDVKVDVAIDAQATAETPPPAKHTTQGSSTGGTQQERSNDPKDQA